MTIFIIIITVAVSVLAFYQDGIMSRLLFNPYQVFHRKEIHRMITHGFLHADWVHLAINMIVLYSFGRNVEAWMGQLKVEGLINNPLIVYGILYFGGIIISSLITLFRHRNNIHYNSVGASGAVSAVIFTSIFFSPLDRIYFFGVVPIPGILFGVIYLIYCSYMSRKSTDNINHDAHFAGAVFGFVFPAFIDFRLIEHFLGAFSF
ncbi:MAG: rhomboid family intramembrane serine protease [Bacteroidales bacterium]|nr:rhomboid family intramembrane serine protease [Bacteroidales bacterium]